MRGVLPARDRELLILRAGFNCGSDYEWGRTSRLAEKLGIAREEIDRVAAGLDADGWSAADAALLRAADELHEGEGSPTRPGPSWPIPTASRR